MAQKQVLVVHDDAEFVVRLRTSVEATGADIDLVNAISGPRAQGLVAQGAPDVIVVDAQLPGFDGYEFTRMVRTNPDTQHVPVVIVTLDANEVTALKARQMGASALLLSSGDPAIIARKIVQLAGLDGAAVVTPGSEAGTGPAAAPPTDAAPVEAPAIGAPAAALPTSAAAPLGTALAAPEAPYGSPQPVGEQSFAARDPAGLPVASGPSSAPMPAASEIPHLDDLLRTMLERGGSDLHIAVGSPPGIRQRGELLPLEDVRPLSPRDAMEMILNVLSEEQRRRFETELELDFAYSIPGVSRFRANVFQQRNSMGAVFRVIPIEIPTLEQLGLPKVCTFLAERPRGLVLVTGPTGSGKSTTLAAMVDHINETRPLHIMTLEDPIEFMHRNKKSYVNQREIGEDTHSFASALRRVLRQDPDVILVGEMRDLETISAAITAAETGHLVLATLHTTGGPETIDRIIDVFPPHQQQQVRMQVSTSLQGVLSQTLLRTTDGRSRVLAMEVMLGVPAINNLIREGKTHQMDTIIQGASAQGMQTLDQSLKALMTAGKVTFEEAISKAKSPKELAAMVGRKL